MGDCSVAMSSLYKDMSADVRVGVRSGVVAVQVERTVVLVLVVVTTHVQHDAGSVVFAVVAYSRDRNPIDMVEKPRVTYLCIAFLQKKI